MDAAGGKVQLASKLTLDQEGRVKVINLQGCEGLVSLPERLGECTALQTIILGGCKGLASMPDLSGLTQLEVKSLPEQLKPWEEGGRKAWKVE